MKQYKPRTFKHPYNGIYCSRVCKYFAKIPHEIYQHEAKCSLLEKELFYYDGGYFCKCK